MIYVTRLNHTSVVLNADLIEYVETTPDTVISLTTGQKLMVRETAEEIVARVVHYRRSILAPIDSEEHARSCVGQPVTTPTGSCLMAEAKAVKPKKAAGGRPDFASLGGLVVGVGGIMTGLLLEGGKVKDVAQFTAALIVFGGTLGAVMLTTPLPVLLRAARQVRSIFFDRVHTPDGVIEEIIEYATQARKQGIVSLEQQAAAIQDPFLRKALNLAVDGIDMSQIRSIMELEITLLEQDGEMEAKVFEAAGGYSPTIGIIGAVLGLIQVMKNLANIDEVGRGIAVAFVATVYGVASANLLFLPAANKLKARVREAVRIREVMLEGVLVHRGGPQSETDPNQARSLSKAAAGPQPEEQSQGQGGGCRQTSFRGRLMWRASDNTRNMKTTNGGWSPTPTSSL